MLSVGWGVDDEGERGTGANRVGRALGISICDLELRVTVIAGR